MASQPSDLPEFATLSDGRMTGHATTVTFCGGSLAIFGPSGAGKTGTAAQMIVAGAMLLVDDLTIFAPRNTHVEASAPPDGPNAMDLRGLGIVPMQTSGPMPLTGVLILSPCSARLPARENVKICERDVPLLRHPASADLPAKAMLWLRYHARTASYK